MICQSAFSQVVVKNGKVNNAKMGQVVVSSGLCTPSYTGSTGNRNPTVNVTASNGLFNNVSGATNLIGGAFNGRFWFNGATLDGSQFVTIDFTNATLVTEFKWFMDTASAQGTWQWNGSQDDVSYTPIGASYTLGGAAAVDGVSTNIITTVSGNTTKYRYYKNIGLSGSINSSPYQIGVYYKFCQ